MKLSWIGLGANNANPNAQFFEILSSASKLQYEELSSELNNRFENYPKLLNLASQTVRNNECWIFKLRATEIEYDQSETKSAISIGIKKIECIKLYESDSIVNSLIYDQKAYLPGILEIHFNSNNKLILQCMMGEDEAEPALLLYYI